MTINLDVDQPAPEAPPMRRWRPRVKIIAAAGALVAAAWVGLWLTGEDESMLSASSSTYPYQAPKNICDGMGSLDALAQFGSASQPYQSHSGGKESGTQRQEAHCQATFGMPRIGGARLVLTVATFPSAAAAKEHYASVRPQWMEGCRGGDQVDDKWRDSALGVGPNCYMNPYNALSANIVIRHENAVLTQNTSVAGVSADEFQLLEASTTTASQALDASHE